MAGFRMYGEITKTIENDDGTITVEGIASTATPDAQGDIVSPEAMKAAIPDYMRFGAIREMHQPIAAGTALSCEVDEEGVTRLEALIVGAESCKKVRAGVLKAFSIGGSIPKDGRDPKNKKIITKLNLAEISLVDRPANPDALLTLAKFEEVNMADELTPPEAGTPNHESLAKWAGEEISDAAAAIRCLGDLFYLWTKEFAEGEFAQAADLQVVIDRLKAFIAAEILEDNSQASGAAMGGIEMAAGATPEGEETLEKAGAKYSRATKAALKAVKSAAANLAECMKAFDDAEADDAAEEEGKEKAEAAEAIQKAAGLEENLSKVQAERDALAEQLAKAEGVAAELKAKLLTKGSLKVVAISKGQDDPLAKDQGTPVEDMKDPLEQIRKIHQGGGIPLPTTSHNPTR